MPFFIYPEIMANDEFQSIQEYGLPLFKEEIAGYTGIRRDEIETAIGDDSSVMHAGNNQSVVHFIGDIS